MSRSRYRAKDVLRTRVLVGIVVVAGLAAGCSSGGGLAKCAKPYFNDTSATALPSYVGISEAQASAMAAHEGRLFRVIGRDSKCSTITADLNRNRVNVYIANGRVVAAAVF